MGERSKGSETIPKPPLLEERLPRNIERNDRQRRKLIAALNGDPMSLGQSDMPPNEELEMASLRRVATGDSGPAGITKVDFAAATVGLARPIDSPFEDIKSNTLTVFNEQTVNGIFRKFIKASGTRAVTESEVRQFLEKYPDPTDFETEGSALLTSQKAKLGESGKKSFKDFKDSMRQMLEALYGKKLQYWDQWHQLVAEADIKFPEESRTRKVFDSSSFGKLYEILRVFRKIRGSKQEYEAEEVVGLIERIRFARTATEKENLLKFLTNTHKIKETVMRLLQNDPAQK